MKIALDDDDDEEASRFFFGQSCRPVASTVACLSFILCLIFFCHRFTFTPDDVWWTQHCDRARLFMLFIIFTYDEMFVGVCVFGAVRCGAVWCVIIVVNFLNVSFFFFLFHDRNFSVSILVFFFFFRFFRSSAIFFICSEARFFPFLSCLHRVVLHWYRCLIVVVVVVVGTCSISFKSFQLFLFHLSFLLCCCNSTISYTNISGTGTVCDFSFTFSFFFLFLHCIHVSLT